ncbi:MAG TPA: efflux RND transporter periplasmic adaptor subunit [Patescibacteria group bacterium]|nr:efflux RND transporter periplasmic adaptor subunit [Patescibacteria group bacterium]
MDESKNGGILAYVKNHKKFVIPATAIVVFLLLRTILLQKPSPDIPYTVKQEDLIDTIQVSGTYTTASQTSISSPTNGALSEIFVNNGDHVKKGDPLFHVESSATADQQKAAYASYMAANATLQTDQAALYALQSSLYSNWKKYTDLATNSTYQNSDGSPNNSNRVLPEFTTSQDNWLAAEANFKNQQNIIAKDSAAVSSTKLLYDETQSTTVTAQTAGTVLNLLSQVGDQVNAPQLNSSPANVNPVLIIANLNNPYISTDISEDYAARINSGQKAIIVFDALKNQSFEGRVDNIATVGNTSSGVVTYGARITAASLPQNVRPNMTALITIETLRKNNVIDVPNSAIVTKDGIDYVQQTKSHHLIPVQVGTHGIAKTEIVSGLASGTTIVVNPNLQN